MVLITIENQSGTMRVLQRVEEPRGDTKGRCQSAAGHSAYSMFQIAGTRIFNHCNIFLGESKLSSEHTQNCWCELSPHFLIVIASS
jgi:hypothetical protein